MRMTRTDDRTQRGQILVIFTLSLTALLGFAGLAIDAGSTFAQQRSQQTASDLAALAGANDFLINGSSTAATTRARTVAGQNGYTHNAGGTTVAVAMTTTNGFEAHVTITSPHTNMMASVLGMPTWQVTTEATAAAGFPDYAHGAAPFIFSADAFQVDGTPLYQTERTFGESNGDIPTSSTDFAWTNYGTGNVSASEVSEIIAGTRVIDKQVEFGEYIGQHEMGNLTSQYGEVNASLTGRDMPVAIVDSSGNFAGWATFHVTGATGGSSKQIKGYFLSAFASSSMKITGCSANGCPRYLGSYILKLTD